MSIRGLTVRSIVVVLLCVGFVAAPVAAQDGGDGDVAPDGGAADTGGSVDTGGGDATDAGDGSVDAGAEPGTDGDDDGANTDWEVIATIALVGVIVAVVGAVLYAFASRERRPSAGAAPAQPSPQQRELSRLVGRSQWVHDSVALNVLGADVGALRAYWADARREIDGLGASTAAAAASSADPTENAALRALGQTLASLTAALETHVSLRSAGAAPGDEGAQLAARESSATVGRRRAELQAAIDRLQAAMYQV